MNAPHLSLKQYRQRAAVIVRRVKYYERRWLRTVEFFSGAAAQNIAERFAYAGHAEEQMTKLKAEFAAFPVEVRLDALGWINWNTHNDGLLEEWIHQETDRAIMIEYDETTWRPVACWETTVDALPKLAML
ncbi:hypothetical protein PAK_P100113 [Pseudomonas phage PAK_P1]|uniref:Uncharacterized protein n=7 Tax=Pakpunavirus TaxID=1921407 RepID=K4RL45_9CAUD|nr:hypothetical protein PAK_P100113 [Pseudomonas phage PAK_P1]YP_007236966.1 hypothetical protein BN405_2-10_Ab1_orf_145 [Pseudomonas phage vB_PaeM_C2-10_Ab1]YP_009623566.1 hypothetical protein FDJ38_gp067 [Pseudomonas phage vB_PaeM_C2-10_Ab02]YP_010762829.1 hypothetical protein QE326_gp154 [Pseudomonas phage PaZq-1]YP_010764863.1 hypothetical protein QE345_gp111 [Pseudomonas phage vB_PA45_GUMS]YP_010765047.1 hypothetical protein QE346_gp063 [Pseudomonas phage phipa10]QAY01631.1 hypothetical 